MSDQDYWDLLSDVLKSPEVLQPQGQILSYSKGIPGISLDPLTFGQLYPDVQLCGDDIKYTLSSALQHKSQCKFKEVRCTLIDAIDEVGVMEDLGELRPIRLNAYNEDCTYDFQNLTSLLDDPMSQMCGIETALYTNHNLFSGQIESVGSAYLNQELKQYSTTNVISKGQLIKDKHGIQKVLLGDKLISKETIDKMAENKSMTFLNQSDSMKQRKEFRRLQRIQEYIDMADNIDEKFIKSQIESIVSNYSINAEQDFIDIWGDAVEPEKQHQESINQQQIEQQKVDSVGDVLDMQDCVISEADIKIILELNDIQRLAIETAKDNNIDDNQDSKGGEQDDNQQVYFNEDDDDEPVFLDQTYYAPKADVALQEQDPLIRQQIEQALSIKTRFRMINSKDVSKHKHKADKHYKWAVEDENDMSSFYDYLPKAKMAKQYPFELDDFQKRAILHLEKKESVFVCAHTSAGKTVVAEYAIAMAFRHNRRALYTSPIKALSNQKYREFDAKFGNTGVVTGDVSINPGAPCLILTTEILRNMLYRRAEMIRDVEWVIFDEVHYVNDQERGMVWEETIIMLPPHIGIIMLSATVPNYIDFADWVGRTRKQKVFVIKTYVRPVPLQHHLYLSDKFHTIKEGDGDFLYAEYSTLKKSIKSLEDEKRGLRERIKKNMDEKKDDELYKNTNQSKRDKFSAKQIKAKFISKVTQSHLRVKDEKRGLTQLIRLCEKKELLPCVIFIFSRKKINDLAEAFTKQKAFKLIDNRTEARIVSFFDKSLQKLKPQDRKSVQLMKLRELLRHGIAMHHGHLLPIAKEIVEILFSEGLIKVLLATETFAMGINMPTKTVIFQALEKFDGVSKMRLLHSSEYTQMSGRAGRRGLDEKGHVIIYVNDATKLPDEFNVKTMVDSKGQLLESKFKITYSVILNLLTVKDMDATEMMKRSFHENYRFIQLPNNLQCLERLKKEYITQSMIACPYQKGIRSGVAKSLIEQYTEISKMFRYSQMDFMHKVMQRSKNAIGFPRYVIISDHVGDITLAVALSQDRPREGSINSKYILQPEELTQYKFKVLSIHSQCEIPEIQLRYKRLQLSYQTEFKVATKQLRQKGEMYYMINEITEESIFEFLEEFPKTSGKFAGQDVMYEECAIQLVEKQQQFEEQKSIILQLITEQNNKKKNPPLSRMKYKLTKIKQQDQQQDDDGEVNEFKYRDQQIIELMQHPCNFCDLKEMHLKQLSRKDQLRSEMDQLRKKLDGGDVEYQNEFDNKLNVLKLLGYVDQNGLPLIKARIARELSDQNSIYMCEMLVDNIMETLNPAEMAALMAGFVCQAKSRKNDEKVNEHNLEHWLIDNFSEISMELQGAILATYTLVRKIIAEELRLDAIKKDDDEAINDILNFNLSEVILMWAKGQSFVDVCLRTDIEEGSIVRTIQRLENMMRGVVNAYKVMGNHKMVEKVEKACHQIKKDIVFAESLYFDQDSKASDNKQNKVQQ